MKKAEYERGIEALKAAGVDPKQFSLQAMRSARHMVAHWYQNKIVTQDGSRESSRIVTDAPSYETMRGRLLMFMLAGFSPVDMGHYLPIDISGLNLPPADISDSPYWKEFLGRTRLPLKDTDISNSSKIYLNYRVGACFPSIYYQLNNSSTLHIEFPEDVVPTMPKTRTGATKTKTIRANGRPGPGTVALREAADNFRQQMEARERARMAMEADAAYVADLAAQPEPEPENNMAEVLVAEVPNENPPIVQEMEATMRQLDAALQRAAPIRARRVREFADYDENDPFAEEQ